MKKYLVASLASVMFLQFGCAQRPQHQNDAQLAEQNAISENEQRIHSLEDKVSALNAQIEQMNSRVYEVRTRNGQKTSMTVVPVNSTTPTPAIQNANTSSEAFEAQQLGKAASPQAKANPQGRKIDPKAKPATMPKTPAKHAAKPVTTQTTAAGPSGTMGLPEVVSGPNGQITAPANGDMALPPAELPPAVVQAAQPAPEVPQNSNHGVSANSNYRGAAQSSSITPPVPVPVLPESGLALPPENPATATPPVQTAPAPQSAAPVVPSQTTASLPKGEVNAYNAALKAVRSGKTNEGIRMFREFLQRYPSGRYAANADYWIGECLYQQGKYQDALSQFNTVNTTFPSHHKNADALLKAGMTLTKMGDRNAANEKFRSILAHFPNSEAARKVKAMGIH